MITFVAVIRRLGARVEEILRTLPEIILHPYRRELYYMRGPGPKWHAKHGLQSAQRADDIS
jgi:hypothetical protein